MELSNIAGLNLISNYFMVYFIVLFCNQAMLLFQPNLDADGGPQMQVEGSGWDLVSRTLFVTAYALVAFIFWNIYTSTDLSADTSGRALKVTAAMIILAVIPMSLSGTDLEKPTMTRWFLPAAIVAMAKWFE